jgi:hypothetical protein
VQVTNLGLALILDKAQRAELVELLRAAPATELGLWLKQYLPENGGTGHVPSHVDDVMAALLPVMAAEINELRQRVEELESCLG